MRPRFLLIAILVAAHTARAGVVVAPGPTALGAAPAAAGASVTNPVARWTVDFQSFLSSPNPDPESVRAAARVLATLNLDDPATKAQLAPLAKLLAKAVPAIIAGPKKGDTDANLEAADTKLEVLNYPARSRTPSTNASSASARCAPTCARPSSRAKGSSSRRAKPRSRIDGHRSTEACSSPGI